MYQLAVKVVNNYYKIANNCHHCNNLSRSGDKIAPSVEHESTQTSCGSLKYATNRHTFQHHERPSKRMENGCKKKSNEITKTISKYLQFTL